MTMINADVVGYQVRWTATTASHCQRLNPEKRPTSQFTLLPTPILLFIPRYLVAYIIRINFGNDSIVTFIFQMAPYPGEHFDPAGLPPTGPHPVFPPQCGECQILSTDFDY